MVVFFASSIKKFYIVCELECLFRLANFIVGKGQIVVDIDLKRLKLLRLSVQCLPIRKNTISCKPQLELISVLLSQTSPTSPCHLSEKTVSNEEYLI